MSTQFHCPSCHTLLSTSTEKTGSIITCPRCRTTAVYTRIAHKLATMFIRWRFLKSRFLDFAPKGQLHASPGQRPRRTPRICTKHKAMLCRELRPFLSVCILALPVCILGLYTQCRHINDHVIHFKFDAFPEKTSLEI